MTWLPVSAADGAAERQAVLGLVPDVHERLEEALAAAWAIADRDLLELCRRRIAQTFGARGADEAPVEARDARERAALEFTDQFVIDGAGVTQEQVDALQEHLDTAALIHFVHALHMVEAELRVLAVLELPA